MLDVGHALRDLLKSAIVTVFVFNASDDSTGGPARRRRLRRSVAARRYKGRIETAANGDRRFIGREFICMASSSIRPGPNMRIAGSYSRRLSTSRCQRRSRRSGLRRWKTTRTWLSRELNSHMILTGR
jgi:hypothetical protein